jgi:hypothetical protein
MFCFAHPRRISIKRNDHAWLVFPLKSGDEEGQGGQPISREQFGINESSFCALQRFLVPAGTLTLSFELAEASQHRRIKKRSPMLAPYGANSFVPRLGLGASCVKTSQKRLPILLRR